MSEQTTQAATPMFYNDPKLLSREVHKDLKLVARANFSFAANVASVPLVATEFAAASAHYPIVFVQNEQAEQPMPMAILGTTTDRNDFVDEKGNWQEGAYVPAYVRRYPFAFATDEQGETLVLCADLESGRFSATEGEPLFTESGASETASRVLSFCNNYQRDYGITEQLVAQLHELELLKPQRLTIRQPGKPNKVLDGLMLIDRARFRTLEDEHFLALRKSGALSLVYAHLASLHRLRQFV